MPTAIVTNMPSCPYCGMLFRTGEDYDDHKPCSESPEAKQRAALRRRITDIHTGVCLAKHHQDEISIMSYVRMGCLDTFCERIPEDLDSIESIVNYLWQEGVR